MYIVALLFAALVVAFLLLLKGYRPERPTERVYQPALVKSDYQVESLERRRRNLRLKAQEEFDRIGLPRRGMKDA